MENHSRGPRWVEVNLEAIRHNLAQVKGLLSPEVKILAVVKGNAYGHGAVEVARLLREEGISMLGVTTVAEALELREAGIEGPILIFGPFLPEDLPVLQEEELTITVADFQAIQWLKEGLNPGQAPLKIHLKVETGMGRLGFWPAQVLEAAQNLLAIPGIELEGVYSHLATAMWQDKSYVREQFARFQEALRKLEEEGIKIPLRHLANSAALLELPELHLDMIRTGTLLYGQFPAPHLEDKLKLRDPWSLKAQVVYLRKLPAGHSVGYGRTYQAAKDTLVAVLPLGFSDGLQMEPVIKPASLWELIKIIGKAILLYLDHPRMRARVDFPGGKAPILGKVGMQLTMVDVTHLKDVKIGTVATVPARRTAISPLIPKLYCKENEMFLQKSPQGS